MEMQVEEIVMWEKKERKTGEFRYSMTIDRFHCHTIKNILKTIQWKKLRNCDVVEDK